MDSDPAPFISNVFLYSFENKWILNLNKSNLDKVQNFTNTFYFVDDLYATNDNGIFEKHFKEIYHEELALKNEYISSNKVSFLDIIPDIRDHKVSNELHDKQDYFSFEIVHIPFFNNNILSNLLYFFIGFEALPPAGNTYGRLKFKTLVNKLLGSISKQASQKRDIIMLFAIFMF